MGASVTVGNAGSTVNPQLYAPNSWPGNCKTRDDVPEISSIKDPASCHAIGAACARLRLGSVVPVVHNEGMALITSIDARPITTRRPTGRRSRSLIERIF